MIFVGKYLLLSCTLASVTWAYNITFYEGDACLDETPLGTFIGGKGQGCQQSFVGMAQGALITSSGPVDDNTMVQFYSTNDCSPGSETSMTSAFCAAINGPGIGDYGSFQVVDDVVTPGLQPTVTVDDQAFAAAASSSATQASTVKRSIRARDDSYLNNTWTNQRDTVSSSRRSNGEYMPKNGTPNTSELAPPNMYHGKNTKVDGVPYRWHQVYQGGYVGVPASEWDPAKHKMDVRSFEEVTLGSESDRRSGPSMSPNPPPYNALEERAFDFSKCAFEQVCGTAINRGLELAIMVAPTVNQAKLFANKSGKVLWEFLQNPFVAAFTAQVIADKIGQSAPQGVTTVIQITGPSPATIAGCSQTSLAGLSIPEMNDQIASIINDMASATVTTAQTIAIAWSGTLTINPQMSRKARRQFSTADSFRLAMDVVSCGSDFSGQLCGLTTGLCEF